VITDDEREHITRKAAIAVSKRRNIDTVADDEPQPIPAGTNYIGADGYLMTWDSEQWRNDGPVSDAVMVCLRMIRSLTDRIAALEGKRR